MLTAVAAVVVLSLGECVEAGTFQISSVEYLTDTSKSTSVTLVSIGAVATYVGPTDSNDNAWALETQLLSGGTTYTGSPLSGSGVEQDMVIYCDPKQYGASAELDNCKLDGTATSYFGHAAVAIYHQFSPEIDQQDGPVAWLECTCSSTSLCDSGEGPGGEETSGGGGSPGSDPTDPNPISPILVDLDRGGIRLSSLADSVDFDLDADGSLERVAWTRAGAGEAWLALDRNDNGTIDTGQELFGNLTPQPAAAEPSGYEALRVFDGLDEGGNLDGRLDAEDAVFSRLLLWTDANHDGISQLWEMRSLAASGIVSLDLDYTSSRRVDSYGNEFRFTSLVELERGTTQSVDVFLLVDE